MQKNKNNSFKKSFVIKGDIAYSISRLELVCNKDSYLVVIDNKIEGIYKDIPNEFKDLVLYDYTNKLIIPGMIDLHIHAPQYTFRGNGMDLELLDWLNTYTFKEESKYSDLDYATKAYSIFSTRMKESATTRAIIFSTIHKDGTLKLMDLMEETGLITYIGKLNMDRNSPDYYIEKSAKDSIDETIKWIEEVEKKNYQNTYPIITPRFTPSCTNDLMEGLGKIVHDYKIPVQSHLSEQLSEIDYVKELEPNSLVYADTYDKYSMFGRSYIDNSLFKTVMAHCVYSTKEEIDLIKKNEVFIAHCPSSNLNVCSGIAPIKKYLDLNLNMGLGSDVAGGESESIFTAMKDAIKSSKMYYRLIDNNTRPLKFEEAFYLATLSGGKFFGNVGSFIKGFDADIIVIDDSNLPNVYDMKIKDRLERCVYLNMDYNFIKCKFVNGRKVL